MSELLPNEGYEDGGVENVQEKIRFVKQKMIGTYIERVGHMFEHEHVGDEDFAGYINEQTLSTGDDNTPANETGLLESLVQTLQLHGHDLSLDGVRDHINKLYKECDAVVVGSYVASLIDMLPDEPVAQSIVNHNISDHPIQQMELVGYDPEGVFMEVHLESLYKHPGGNLRTKIQTELQQLAETIVSQHPNTEAVVGTSWLMDTKLAKRFGFTVVEGYEDDSDSLAIRGQLIDAKGGIREDLRQLYIAKGELPHKVKTGYMPIKDFLARYLRAKEGNDTVTLMEEKQETRNETRLIRREQRQFEHALSENWNTALLAHESFDAMLQHLDSVPHYHTFLKEHDLLSLFTNAYRPLFESGTSYRDVVFPERIAERDPTLAERLQVFEEAFDQTLNNTAYTSVPFDLALYRAEHGV